MWQDIDTRFMLRAISLAKRGLGRTEPNPAVGAVIVKDGRVVSEGYHRGFGSDHAELAAIKNALRKGVDIRGAHLYVSLEPCVHFGKTPPCVDAIIKHGITRVCIGAADPFFKVSGRGIKRLQESGIEVILAPEDIARKAIELNRWFYKFFKEGSPWVICKWAQTIDGKLATRRGDSKWISSSYSLRVVHKLRASCQAIMVGIGTVIKDNPSLTIRYGQKQRVPLIRAVLDKYIDIPLDSVILDVDDNYPTYLFVSELSFEEKKDKVNILKDKGVFVVPSPTDAEDRLELEYVLRYLAGLDCRRLLVEGGAKLLSSFLINSYADELYVFVSPKLAIDSCSYQLSGRVCVNIEDFVNMYRIESSRVIAGEDILLRCVLVRS